MLSSLSEVFLFFHIYLVFKGIRLFDKNPTEWPSQLTSIFQKANQTGLALTPKECIESLINAFQTILPEESLLNDDLQSFLDNYHQHEHWQFRVYHFILVSYLLDQISPPDPSYILLEQYFWMALTNPDPRILPYLVELYKPADPDYTSNYITSLWERTPQWAWVDLKAGLLPIPISLSEDQIRSIDLDPLIHFYAQDPSNWVYFLLLVILITNQGHVSPGSSTLKYSVQQLLDTTLQAGLWPTWFDETLGLPVDVGNVLLILWATDPPLYPSPIFLRQFINAVPENHFLFKWMHYVIGPHIVQLLVELQEKDLIKWFMEIYLILNPYEIEESYLQAFEWFIPAIIEAEWEAGLESITGTLLSSLDSIQVQFGVKVRTGYFVFYTGLLSLLGHILTHYLQTNRAAYIPLKYPHTGNWT